MIDVDRPQIVAVDLDQPLVIAVQCLQEAGYGGLARAAAADNAEDGALRNAERDPVERRLGGPRVFEGDLVELDAAGKRGADAAARAALFRRLVDDIGGQVDRIARLVDLDDRLRRLDHRHRHPLGHDHEGEDRAEIHRVFIDEREINRDGDDPVCHQHLERVHHGLDHVGREPLVEPRLRHAGDMHVPGVTLPGIEGQRLDRADAVDRLDQVDAARRLRLHRQADLAPDRGQHGHQHKANQQADRKHACRHDRADHEHDRQKDHQDKGIQQRPKQLARQERAHPVDLVHVMDDIAGRRALKKVNRQVQHLVEHMRPYLDVDPCRHKQHQVTSQMPECCFK